MKLLNNKILKITLTIALFLASTTSGFCAISTDAKLQYNKGIDYYQLGQFEESATCFKKAIELDPNYIDAYYNLGSLLEYLKQDEAALSVFKQIILRKPDDYESVYKAAQLSKKLGEYDKAKMYLTLIPKDTLIGQKAVQLSNSMPSQEQAPEEKPTQPTTMGTVENNTAQSAQEYSQEQSQEQSQPTQYPQEPENLSETDNAGAFVKANPENNSNGIYQDISSPTGIVSDESGNLFVAGFSDNTIYKITPDNRKLVFIKSSKIDGPIGLTMDVDGCLYIANYNKNNVLKVDQYGTITELITDIPNPYCMYITDNLLFVSSQGSNSVIRYKLK